MTRRRPWRTADSLASNREWESAFDAVPYTGKQVRWQHIYWPKHLSNVYADRFDENGDVIHRPVAPLAKYKLLPKLNRGEGVK